MKNGRIQSFTAMTTASAKLDESEAETKKPGLPKGRPGSNDMAFRPAPGKQLIQ
jgi:hypothetical protein